MGHPGCGVGRGGVSPTNPDSTGLLEVGPGPEL